MITQIDKWIKETPKGLWLKNALLGTGLAVINCMVTFLPFANVMKDTHGKLLYGLTAIFLPASLVTIPGFLAAGLVYPWLYWTLSGALKEKEEISNGTLWKISLSYDIRVTWFAGLFMLIFGSIYNHFHHIAPANSLLEALVGLTFGPALMAVLACLFFPFLFVTGRYYVGLNAKWIKAKKLKWF